MSTTISKKRNF